MYPNFLLMSGTEGAQNAAAAAEQPAGDAGTKDIHINIKVKA